MSDRICMTVGSASYMTGLFLVPSSVARSVVPDDYFRVAEVFPGKAVFFVGAGEFRSSDIGAYREFYVGFYTENRETGRRPSRISNLIELVKNTSKMFMWRSYVSSTAATDKMDRAGSTIFRLGEIERQDLEGSVAFTLEHEEDGSVRFSTPLESRSTKSDFRLERTHYGRLHGKPARCQLDLDIQHMAVSPRKGELSLQGKIGSECEALGLPKKPLATVWIDEMSFRMHRPEALPAERL